MAATTLALCILGITGAVLMAARRSAAVLGLAALFTCAALRQAHLLYSGALPGWAADATSLGEFAVLGMALGGLGALRALHRTTRERDRAEDLHWDSMEAVRIVCELAARPGASFEDKLGSVLELGTSRFRLDLGVAWDGSGEDGGGRVLAVRAPRLDAETLQARIADLEPRLRDARHATRPLLLLDRSPKAASPTFFAVAVTSGGRQHGVLAFAGARRAENRFTATDKDLLALMAWWVAAEIDRTRSAPAADAAHGHATPASAEAPAPVARPAAPPVATLARVSLDPARGRRGVDLNRGIARLEHRLRQRVGTDGTLTLDLQPDLPAVARGRLSLPRLLEGLVDAAARLAPTGHIEVATRPPRDDGREVTLRVAVSGPGVDARAFERAFAPPADPTGAHEVLGLADVERLLRLDGGDLSVSIEPQRRAVLTAWVPVAPHKLRNAPPVTERASDGPAGADQPSR